MDVSVAEARPPPWPPTPRRVAPAAALVDAIASDALTGTLTGGACAGAPPYPRRACFDPTAPGAYGAGGRYRAWEQANSPGCRVRAEPRAAAAVVDAERADDDVGDGDDDEPAIAELKACWSLPACAAAGPIGIDDTLADGRGKASGAQFAPERQRQIARRLLRLAAKTGRPILLAGTRGPRAAAALAGLVAELVHASTPLVVHGARRRALARRHPHTAVAVGAPLVRPARPGKTPRGLGGLWGGRRAAPLLPRPALAPKWALCTR